MKILKHVTVEFDFVIVVDTENPTLTDEEIARDSVVDAFHDISIYDYEYIIDDYIPGCAIWDNDCIPYGGDGETKTGDILKNE